MIFIWDESYTPSHFSFAQPPHFRGDQAAMPTPNGRRLYNKFQNINAQSWRMIQDDIMIAFVDMDLPTPPCNEKRLAMHLAPITKAKRLLALALLPLLQSLPNLNYVAAGMKIALTIIPFCFYPLFLSSIRALPFMPFFNVAPFIFNEQYTVTFFL